MENAPLRSFPHVLQACKRLGKMSLAVAAAQNEDLIRAVKNARDEGIADSILVGDETRIAPMAAAAGLEGVRIIHEPDEAGALRRATLLVREGRADALMKGLVNTSDFLRAVLNDETGLKTSNLLSHLAAFEIPGQKKLHFYTDGGINIHPCLAEKKTILLNALDALARLGIRNPNVAVLSANERVNPKMPSTTDAAALAEMRRTGEIPSGIVEGPIALDVAVNPHAAEEKGIHSEISGAVDLFLVPNIEAGNLLGKALVYFARAKMAGLVLGASCPIILTSRAETAEGKLNSIALAGLIALSKG